MRLAILNLTGGGTSGGHRNYLQGILPRLAGSGKFSSILCASPASIGIEKWLPDIPTVRRVECEPFRPFRHEPGPMLKAALDSFGPDLLFVTVERYVRYRDLPVVIFLHNMAPLAGIRTGSGLRERLVSLARAYEARYAIKRAAAVIAPTDFVRDYLIARENASPGRVTRIHFGAAPLPAKPVEPEGFPFRPGEFIFTAGSLEAYRGIEDIIKALPALKAALPGIKLAVAGGARPEALAYASGLRKLASELGVDRDIAWLGNLDAARLAWCYAHCSVCVLTSRMESFCFVALEAMQHSCRVVAADRACLPEVLGGAADYYKAGDHEALSSLLSKKLASGRPPAAGPAARTALFSWDKAAAATLDVLLKAASRA